MTGSGGYKQAQRRFRAEVCSACGGRDRVQRHHIDRNPTNNDPSNILILCHGCHRAVHVAEGGWGKPRVPKATCEICGTEFQPVRSRNATLCGKPECEKEKGRRAAILRWGEKKTLVATCEICGTEFKPKRPARATLCGQPSCQREKGRRSAALQKASHTT